MSQQAHRISNIVSSLGDLLPFDTVNALLAGYQRQLHAPITIVDRLANQPHLLLPEAQDASEILVLEASRRSGGEPVICHDCDFKQLASDIVQYYKDNQVAAYQRQCADDRFCLLHLITCRQRPLAALRAGPYDSQSRSEQDLPSRDNPQASLGRLAAQVQDYVNIADSKRTLEECREFLRSIRTAIQDRGFSNGAPTLLTVKEVVSGLLGETSTFCGIRYAAFFTNVHPDEWILPSMGWAGLPIQILDNLPHFNWKKSGLPSKLPYEYPYASEAQEIASKGIRGANTDFFQDVGILWPVQMGHHRGIFVFGSPDGKPLKVLDMQFINEVCDTISSYAFIEIDFLLKEQEAKRWQSTAQLIDHQVGTITGQIINLITVALQKLAQIPQTHNTKIAEQLRLAKAQCFDLSASARRTLEGRLVDDVFEDDLQRELFPLAVLIENCVDSFSQSADKGGRTLTIDDNVLRLPDAEVDVARLSIALSNIIHNAMKYSFPNTKIFVRAFTNYLEDTDNLTVTIEIDDLGDEIPLSEQQSIFQKGVRGQKHKAQTRFEGSGLGLWEASSIVHAHNGSVKVSCEPTSIVRPQGRGFKVIFSITLPLHGNQQ